MIHTALAEGLLWSGLWMAYLYMIMKFFPWEMLHDYPEDVRKASTLPVPDKEQKRSDLSMTENEFWQKLKNKLQKL